MKKMLYSAIIFAATLADGAPLHLQSFCGHQFGSPRTDDGDGDVVQHMEKPFRVFDKIRLGYHSHSRKLMTIKLEGDVYGWSFAAITNEVQNIKSILEKKLGITFKYRIGSHVYSSDTTSIMLTGVPHRRMVNRRLLGKRDDGSYFSIYIKRLDLLKEWNNEKAESDKKQYTISHSIPPGQDRDVLTFTTNAPPCDIIPPSTH